jgi:hypothetical protein
MVEKVLGVPLHTDHWIRQMLNRLNGSVLGPRRGTKTFADRIHGLMMDAVDTDTVLLLYREQLRAGIDAHTMRYRFPLHHQVGQGRVVRKVLDQGAAQGNVQDLAASAYSQDRHSQPECLLQQRNLPVIAIRIDSADLRRRSVAIALRIDIAAPGEKETVEPCQSSVSRGTRGSWQQMGDPARLPDSRAIGLLHHVEAAGPRIHPSRRDADHRALVPRHAHGSSFA